MNSFMQWFWLMVWWFAFVMYLIVLFQIVTDLFRDKDLSGWLKALWLIGLILLPFLVALIYVIARGRSMAERQAARAHQARSQTESYIRDVASASPSADIARAKELLDAGVIDAGEFAQLKAKALA
ncbi:SHOCT domain-containing protein [Cellulomonas sp. PhB150]|uniref:SHOCT domain-containing protein n=1 Tax=Cellulomonas sp. PhB150 TaxID=2485188 RepID=UPI000F48BF1A|nr:SHOCT domain-containing protein [Cellulomonas sp. PhB150]ROS27887.1 phospholipase D-like protein [Cellulomonas sp. PhB150]